MKTSSWALFATGIYAQSLYGENHVAVNFDSQLVEQMAFPAPNVTLLSPAFLPGANASFAPGWTKGTEGATSLERLTSFLRRLAAKNPTWMTVSTADFVSEEGNSFPYVLLSTSKNTSTTKGDSKKLRVWIQGSVHGNEPAGDEATLALLGAMDANLTWAASFLEKMDILVLPRYNPDGNAYFQRTLATNFDPNRDHTKLARQQTRDIKSWFASFAPHIAIDMHEYSAGTRYAENYANAADGMFSAAKNLNIHPTIRSLSESLFAPAITHSLTSHALRPAPYMTSSNPRSPTTTTPRLTEAGTDAKIGRNSMGLTQCITFLFETRGIGIAHQAFARRTFAGVKMVQGVLDAARAHHGEVLRGVEAAVADMRAGKGGRVVVTDYPVYANGTWGMVDRRSGAVVQVPVEFGSNTPAIANLTRERPAGYVVPRAWGDVAERLRVSGVEVETLPDGFRGAVEAYNITRSSLARGYYEGVVLNTVTTAVVKQEISLPKGSYWVSARQKNAGLAFVALEPEGIDSYVSFGIVPVEVGDVYPIFRKM
ncbi:hypothetical protein GQ44DRAFT_767107 [Phaeosphaeriaceae sp. PMI808]|nr:hypothetical protein GQ44DRAFT_767107 [Phaeosphaeriaceae sp. PMI808]